MQFLFDPGLYKGHGRPLGLQPVVKFLYKGCSERNIGMCKLGQQLDQLLRIAFSRDEHAVSPGNGHIAFFAPLRDAHTHPAQVFQQRQLQHDRKRPQFAQLQGFNGLIGGDELGHIIAVDPTVHVGNQLQRQIINTRKSSRVTSSQTWQLPAVAAREVSTRLANLLLDQIEIVEQPGFGRYDPLARRRGCRDDIVGRKQNPCVVRQPRQQSVRARVRVDSIPTCQGDRVTLQLLNTEQLRTQQIGIPRTVLRLPCACRESERLDGYETLPGKPLTVASALVV